MLNFTDALREFALTIALMNGNVTAQTLLQPQSFHCIAITAYAEARGEGRQGMALVVQSIINRHQIQGKPSCKIAHQAYDGFRAWQHLTPPPKSGWNAAQMVALNVIMGRGDLGACSKVTHFLNPAAVRRMPGWANSKNRICSVGNHVAYHVPNL